MITGGRLQRLTLTEYYQIIPRQKDFRSTSRKYSSLRYQIIFLGHCYYCTNFGHMENYCREYHKDKYNGPRQSSRRNFARRSHDYSFMNKMECFNCHNIGHMARECNLTWVPKTTTTNPEKKVKQVWRRKKVELKSPLNTSTNNTCF